MEPKIDRDVLGVPEEHWTFTTIGTGRKLNIAPAIVAADKTWR